MCGQARQLLGSSIRAGQLRAYVLRTGTFGLDSETRKLTWLRPRVQMLFQVVGSEREVRSRCETCRGVDVSRRIFVQGMACVEGTRKLGSLRKVHVNMLTLDVLRSDGDSTMVLVTGSPERLKVCAWPCVLPVLALVCCPCLPLCAARACPWRRVLNALLAPRSASRCEDSCVASCKPSV